MRTTSVQQAQPYSPAKKVAKAVVTTAATAAVVTAGLAVGANKGVFTKYQGSNEILKKGLSYLNTAGSAINTKLGALSAKIAELGIKDKIQNSKVVTVAKEKAGALKTKLGELKQKVVTSNFAATLKSKFDAAKQYVQTHIGKFDPSKANPADLAAETFNGFVK